MICKFNLFSIHDFKINKMKYKKIYLFILLTHIISKVGLLEHKHI